MLMIRHRKHFSSTYSTYSYAYECSPLCNNMINLHVLFGKLLEKLMFFLQNYCLYLQIWLLNTKLYNIST